MIEVMGGAWGPLSAEEGGGAKSDTYSFSVGAEGSGICSACRQISLQLPGRGRKQQVAFFEGNKERERERIKEGEREKSQVFNLHTIPLKWHTQQPGYYYPRHRLHRLYFNGEQYNAPSRACFTFVMPMEVPLRKKAKPPKRYLPERWRGHYVSWVSWEVEFS